MSEGDANQFWRNNEYLFLLLAVSLVAQLGVVGAMVYSGRITIPHASKPARVAAGGAKEEGSTSSASKSGGSPSTNDSSAVEAGRDVTGHAQVANVGATPTAPTAAQSETSAATATSETNAAHSESVPPAEPAGTDASGGSAAPTSAPSDGADKAPATTSPSTQDAQTGQQATGQATSAGSSGDQPASPTVAKADPASEPVAPAASSPAIGGSARMEQLLGPVQQPLTEQAAAARATAAAYRRSVLAQLAKAKRAGVWEGQPGTAAVHFVLGSKGEVLSCEVVRKSADPALNAEAVAMVRRGAPYPAPPPDVKREFTIGLRFEPSQ